MQLHDSVVALVKVTWGDLANARIILPDALPILVGFGKLSSLWLCSSAAAIGLIAVTNGRAVPALFKKRLQYLKKKNFP